VSGTFSVASGESIPEEVRWAGALGPVVAGVAVGVLAANCQQQSFDFNLKALQ
jgi:hypothetical protein